MLKMESLKLRGLLGLMVFTVLTTNCFGEDRPNIVLIMIDDMGLVDIEPYGSTYYETPNINKLASQGMKFTKAYAASNICSPTRHALMTGKYPERSNFTNVQHFKDKKNQKLIPLPQDPNLDIIEYTFAEAFKTGGYRTGFIGKWHMGGPTGSAQGFDLWDEIRSTGGSDPWLIENEDPKEVTEIIDKSLFFIDDALADNKPFMLYMAHRTVHVKLETTKDLHKKYTDKKPGINGQNNPYMAGMVEDLDSELGRFFSELERKGLTDNTVIIFTSDNGGLVKTRSGRVTSNAPLRGGKGTWYEGGTRVPLIVKFPGKIKAGTLNNVPTITMDLYPTMLELAGLPLQPKQHLDGLSIKKELTGKGDISREALYWHYPHYKAANMPHTSIVKGDYKLIVFHDQEFSPHGGKARQLYHLGNDVGETDNIARQMPEKANELYQLIIQHRNTVDAQIPVVNKNWRASKRSNR